MTTDHEAAPGTATQEKPTGRRVVAAIVDVVLVGIVFWVLAMFFGETRFANGSFSIRLGGVGFVLYILFFLAYYAGLESRTGQTVGKALLGVRVVAEETGAPPSLGKALVRTLLRIVDVLPFLYLVGLISIAATEKDQRIGDMAADTVVVRA